MTKAMRKNRERHFENIRKLDIDEDIKKEAIDYILFLEQSKKEARKTNYIKNFDSFTTSGCLLWLITWKDSKQGNGFWNSLYNKLKESEKKVPA